MANRESWDGSVSLHFKIIVLLFRFYFITYILRILKVLYVRTKTAFGQIEARHAKWSISSAAIER